MRGVTMIFVSALFFLSELSPAHALELRGGAFLQSNTQLFSGGAFASRDVSMGGAWSFVGRGGAWLLRDRGETPAPAPTLEAAIRFEAPFGLRLEPGAGAGYTFLVDQGFFQLGLKMGWKGSGLLDRLSLHGSLLSTRPQTAFLGMGVELPF